MRRPLVGMLFGVAACLILVPATAHALEIHQHYYVEKGPMVREVMRVVHVAPPDADDDGLANRDDECPKQSATTDNGCVPEPVAIASPDSVAPTPVGITVAPSSGGCPASLAGESTDPAEPSTSSTDPSGCIQAMPSTWSAYGGDTGYGSAGEAPVDVQMQVLGEICAAQGNDAWTAADPC